MTFIKRSAVIFLCICLLITLSACQSGKDTDDGLFNYDEPTFETKDTSSGTYNGFLYETSEDGNVVITGYESNAKNAIIPSQIHGKSVTSISPRACFENGRITSLSIPDTIMTIGAEAFYGCSQLEKVEFGSNIAYIGGRAFDNTPFVNFITDEFYTVGNGVLLKYTGKQHSVTVPADIKCISSAFESNAILEEVILPEGLIYIGDYSFSSCTQLKSVNIPSTVTEIGTWAFAKCIMLNEINMPDTITKLGDMCFLYCSSLTKVTLSASLKELPVGAFQACSTIENIIIPEGITTLADQVFFRCSKLKNVTVPASVESLGYFVFNNCDASLTVTCPTSSKAAQYCLDNSINTELE